MPAWFWKSRRKKKSRNERAEKYASRFYLRRGLGRGLGPRFILAALFVVAGMMLLPPAQPTKEIDFKEGQIADRDIIAPFNFKVPLSGDELEVARAKAALTVPPVYRRSREVERDLSRDLGALLDTITTVIVADTLDAEGKVALVSGWLPSVSRSSLRAVATARTFRDLNSAAREYQATVFDHGLIDNASLIRRHGYREISVLDAEEERTRRVSDVYEQGRLDQVIREDALGRFGNNRDKAQVFFELVRGHLLPNLVFDVNETNRRRSASTATVKDYFEISKSERVIGKHDKVTREQERILRALEETRVTQEAERSPLATFALYLGESLRLLLFCVVFGGYLWVFHRRVYEEFAELLAVFSVVLIYAVFTAVVVRFGLSPYLVPVAFLSVMLSALFDFRTGLVAAVFGAALIPLVTSFPPGASFAALLAGGAGVIGIEKMRARSHVYSIFLHVSLAYVAGVFAFELGRASSLREIATQAMWGVANGMFSSAAVMFLLPIFEHVFNRTSRFTLLELTDLNKPILKRLNMEAHGTYHHSMLIGNLVDSAAELIGADALKARVMAYYHDIGKMFKPEYFAENQNGGFNKHEKITPQMSALILVSHVKDGVELAREEKLPAVVIEGIREHHGTSVMAYFYQKALETDSHSSVNKDDFRYPGPKPKTKETGLLMCADTVEAAVRSLNDPTPANIRNMVTKLIDGKAREGELDDSGLTLSDLGVIKERFITILTGIYHKRIAYPGQEEAAADGTAEPARGAQSSESVAKSV
jgi:putative nucleotidyltransferase with HDIG domain